MEVVGMSDLLEFRLLKYIAMIAETGNFTRAAERLYLAQPSLPQRTGELCAAISHPADRHRDGCPRVER
jgi:hypothetical protein